MGWIGSQRAVSHYLATVNADRDDQGYIVRGSLPSPYLGLATEDNDVVVDDRVEYRVGGRWANLAAGLNSTSQGMGVKVY